MDYPRALDSSPEDRGLGVRDWANAKFGRQFQAPSTPSRPIWTSVSGPSYPYTPSRPIWTSVSGPSYPYTPSRPIWTSVSGPYMHYHCAVSSFKPNVCIEDKMANFSTFLFYFILFCKFAINKLTDVKKLNINYTQWLE